jgi:aerobic-type carbon monoxide dehydrogenase small subunit (CoxS/CutS family)
MLSVRSIVSVEVNGKNYEFSCAPDSPLPDALEANNQINAFLLGRVQQAQQAQSKAAEEQKQPVE